MRLSLRGEYALRALVALGGSYDGEVVSMHTVAEQQEIPKRFLEQIFNDLRAGGFVESKRGMAGGYRLARPAEEITLVEVIRHVEGTLTSTSAVSRKPPGINSPAGSAQVAVRGVMREVRNAVVTVLSEVTIADLCERSRLAAGELAVPDYTI